MTASLISVNVGLPKTVQFQDRSVTTGIFKSPVEGPVAPAQTQPGRRRAGGPLRPRRTDKGRVRIPESTLYVLA